MATVLETTEQRVLLRSVSWETYERLLAEKGDASNPRFTYNRGELEIMSPSTEHEQLKEIFTLLVNVIAEEMRINSRALGSTTFRREDLARGFEPDSCFYFHNEPRIRGKKEIDLTVDPPPDLVIEIDITHSSLDKLPIFAQIGVPEVWRYDGKQMFIFKLEDEKYAELKESAVLLGLTTDIIMRFLTEGCYLESLTWLREVRAWARGINEN